MAPWGCPGQQNRKVPALGHCPWLVSAVGCARMKGEGTRHALWWLFAMGSGKNQEENKTKSRWGGWAVLHRPSPPGAVPWWSCATVHRAAIPCLLGEPCGGPCPDSPPREAARPRLPAPRWICRASRCSAPPGARAGPTVPQRPREHEPCCEQAAALRRVHGRYRRCTALTLCCRSGAVLRRGAPWLAGVRAAARPPARRGSPSCTAGHPAGLRRAARWGRTYP